MNSLRDEIEFMFSGQGMPYHKVSMVLAVFIAVIFTVVYSNNYIKEADVAVIDIDNSRFSRSFIEDLDASPFIHIKNVYQTPQNPDKLMYHDEHIAVLYIPHDFEKKRYSKTPNNIGVFYDNINAAQLANLREALNEIIAEANAPIGIEQIQVLGLNALQMQSIMQNISLKERLLFNPVDAHSNSSTFGFLFFFGTMFLVFATIGLVPRLKLERKWPLELQGTSLGLMLRTVPYVVCFTVSMVVGLMLTRVIGDLTVLGNYFTLLAVIVLLGFSVALMAVFIGWSSANPGVAASRMIFFLPGGFILGGASGPMNVLPGWVQVVSNVFPLVWGYRLLRDVMLRGAGFWDCLWEFGTFMIFIGVLAVLVHLRFGYEAEKNSAAAGADREAEHESV